MVGNVQMFELMNAPADAGALPLAIAIGVARWRIWTLPPAIVPAWLRAAAAGRRDWLQMLLAVLIAPGIGLVVGFAWPQRQPAALHLGQQFLQHGADPGLPSDHAAVFWSRVYRGVHFPYSVAAELRFLAAGVGVGRGVAGLRSARTDHSRRTA